MPDPVKKELEYRRNAFAALLKDRGPKAVSPHLIRKLGIYGGAQGIWVDKRRTWNLTDTGNGVTVSLLHTGTSYADDLSDDGVLYHYPKTNRPIGRDASEIEATKAAGKLGLPVFVITYPSPKSVSRDVHYGWVEGWDDEARLFLVSFADSPTRLLDQVADDEPFDLHEEVKSTKREVAARQGQQRFKFQVFQRYGSRCALCGIGVKEVLDASHIMPRKYRGSNDPRNGLVLCALHHRAFDEGLFAIEPNTLRICFRKSGSDALTLRIEHPTIEHLPRRPHKEALLWRWEKWRKK